MRRTLGPTAVFNAWITLVHASIRRNSKQDPVFPCRRQPKRDPALLASKDLELGGGLMP